MLRPKSYCRSILKNFGDVTQRTGNIADEAQGPRQRWALYLKKRDCTFGKSNALTPVSKTEEISRKLNYNFLRFSDLLLNIFRNLPHNFYIQQSQINPYKQI